MKMMLHLMAEKLAKIIKTAKWGKSRKKTKKNITDLIFDVNVYLGVNILLLKMSVL